VNIRRRLLRRECRDVALGVRKGARPGFPTGDFSDGQESEKRKSSKKNQKAKNKKSEKRRTRWIYNKIGGLAEQNQPLMLYQSFESNTCAICVFANLLNLYGLTCSRKEAVYLLEASTDISSVGVTHSKLLSVIANQLRPKLSLGWKSLPRFSFDKVLRVFSIVSANGAPAVLTFYIRHPRKHWFGLHCAIAMQADDTGIHLIDSLGRRDGKQPNATITSQKSTHGWVVEGAPVIVTEQPVRILDGLPRLPKTSSR
jgi:hypothetical protein